MDNTDYLLWVPIIVGVIEVMKKAGLPDNYAPVVALLLGVAGAFASSGMNTYSVFNGILAGLSASGLYSGYKATILQK